MPKQPGYRRPLIEAIEPRLLFSATADIAVFDDATHHHTDLATAAQQLDLEQVYLQQEQLPPLATEFAASPMPATEQHNLVFIDTSVTDYQTLVKDILANPDNKNIELIYLNPQQDAITQITNTLNHYSNVEGIHILSHGDAGVLEIGNQILTDGNIKNYQQELIQWAKSLTEDADILLYGCNLAASPAGVSLMQQLGQLTGADIAASTDITGSKNANGDWQLEKNLGNIEHNSLIAADQHTQWQGDLGTTIYATSGSTASTQVLSPGQNLYQSFTYTSGNGTYSVDNIRMMLQKDAFAQAQTVTVELSASLNGAAIASNTVSSASLSTSLAWYSFNISGTTLTDGQTYYIKIKTSGNDGLVTTGIINSDTYAGGSLFYDSLTPDANRELSFEVNAVTGNTAPVVNNPLVSQTATKGMAFTYTFAANSFTDADGDTLTYTAAQQLGAALPSWLTFDANTRTFSGTPTSLADVHPITVRVTASDGSGHNTYDDFVLNVSNRIEAENYGQTSGTSIETTSDSGGGSDLTSIDPADWAGYFNSLFGYTGTYHADWRVASTTGGSIKLEPYGGGAVYDTISVPNTGGAQNWVTVGSSFTMADLSTVDFAIAGVTGSVSINWFELTQYDKPTVSRALVDQQVSLNVPFSYQFSNTAGSNVFESNDSLTYSATLSDGSALPSWLSFDAATRTFTGTQTNSDLGDLSVRVTATDTHGGSVYDDFAISDAVNNAPVNTLPGGQTLNEDGSITFNQGAGITGTYYNNKTLTGPAAGTRTDANIDFVWPADPGIGGIGSDNFSARWSGQLHVTETGNFQFQTASDDGVRVYVDGELVIDNWTNHALETNNSGNIALTAGKTYSVVVEYYESTGDSEINLNWMTPSSGGFSAIPTGNASNMQQGLYLGNTISVSDIDAGSGNLQVTLSVAHGTLSLPTNSGLTFTTGDGTGDATMVFQGTKDDINSALAFLSYTPTANYNGSDSLSIITSDLGNSGTGGPLTDSDSIAITVNSVNDSPTGTDKTITSNEDSAYTFGVSDFGFNDPDAGDTISAVRIDSLPAAGSLKLSGVSVVAGDIITSANIGNLVFTPAANANGNNYASFTFSVRDQTNLFDAAPNTITLNISAVNDTPTVSNIIPDQNATQGSAFNFQFASNSFNDIDVGDTLSYTAQLNGGALPAWLNFNAATRTFSGTPANADVGTISIDVTADDGNGGTVTDTFNIAIANINDAPTVANAIADQNATEDSAFNFQFASNTFNDVDVGNTLTYTAQLNGGGALPSWLNFNAATRTFSGTPANADVGAISIDVSADDGNGGTVTDTFNIVIANTNDAPTVANSIANQNATEDSAFNFQFASNTFNDVDVGNTLTYIAQLNGGGALPSWLNFNAATRTFSGTPANADVGTIALDVTADDGNGGTVTDTFNIVIANINDAPTVANSIADQNATEDSAFSFQFASNTFNDVDAGNTLTYTAQLNGGGVLPSWLNFNAATRTFSGTPANADVGTISIDVTADDGNGGTVADTFNIVVANTNDAPTVANAISDQNATEDSAFSFQFASNTFNDVDVGNTLIYTAQLNGGGALPSWLNFNATTRTFSGTPANADVGTISIDVTADDGNGGTVTDTFNIVVANTNDAPTVANSIADQNATEDSAFSFQFASNTFNDVDVGNTLTYTAQLNGGGALPSWLNFNATTRTFSGTPANADVGTISIDVTADDGNGGTVTDTFNIVVANTNDVPTVANTIADQNATEDSAFSFQFASNTFNDVDVGNTLTYTAQLNGGGALPSWLNFNAATRTFSGTPANADVGTIAIDVTADDGNGGTVTDTFNIVVANTNDAPTVANAISDQNATEDSAFSFQFASNAFNDVDVGNTLTYTAQLNGGGALPSWLNFNAATRTFSGTPANADVGSIAIDVTADDGNSGTVTDTFNIVVANTNDAPTVANALADQNATEDSAFNFQFASNTFNDIDVGNTLTYTAQLNGGGILPSWLSFNAATRTFSGTPTNSDVGTIVIDVTADDSNGGAVTDTFNIVVANTNDVPTVANSIADQNATEDSAFNFQFASNTFNDIDVGTTLTYTAQLNGGGVLPSWLSFNAATRTFSGTPANADVGTISIDVTADDSNGGAVSDTFNIVVANTNDAPTVANSIADQNATEDSAFNFQFASNTFNDVDAGNTLTYTAQLNGGGALPSWLNFNAATRTFSGTPANADIGTISIDVTADDGNGGTVTDTFNIVVANTNDAPTVANSIADQNATEDSAFSFQFVSNTFNDVDVGNTLTYTAQLNGGGALPSWLNFNATTRTFSGTPANADVGTISIDVTADDGNGGTVTDTFNIVIANTNDAPTVANTIPGQNATQGSAFSFQLAFNAFTDQDIGDTLSYSSQLNGGGTLPSWLSFDAATRTFSGIPGNSDIGAVNIDVIADDGNGGIATQTFTINVANANDGPSIANAILDQTINEDTPLNFQFASNTFVDLDPNTTLTYSAQLSGGGALPSWLSFNATTRTFSGTPTNSDVGIIALDVTADDGNGGTITDNFTITVININDAPTVANPIPDQTTSEGTAFNFQVPSSTFNDVDAGSSLSYSAQLNGGNPLPSWLIFDNATHTFSGIPTNSDVGVIAIELTADDGNGGTVTDTFNLIINNANNAPFVANALTDQNATEDSAFTFQIPPNSFSDVDVGNTLTYGATLNGGGALPSWLGFDAATRTFSGTPTNADVGTIAIDVTADDGNGGTVTDTFNIMVANTNDAPIAINPIANQTATENSLFRFQVPSNAFDDIDAGDSLTYSAKLSNGNPLPHWLQFDAATKTFAGTPAFADQGETVISVIATDNAGQSASSSFNLQIASLNEAPTSDGIMDIKTIQGSLPDKLDLSSIFSDREDGHALHYTIASNTNPTLISSIVFDAKTNFATLNYNPLAAGQADIVIRATDNNGAFVDTQFHLTIVPVPPKVEVPTTDTETVKSPLPSDANPIDFKPVETGTASQPAQETTDARHNESDNNGNKNSITPNAKEENHTGTIDVSHLNQVTSPTIDPIHLNPDKLFTTADDKFNPNRYDRIVQHETQLKKNNDQWLSHSAISSLILPYEGFSTQDLQELASELRKVHHDMDEAIAHENQQKMLVTGITLSITTGVIIWTLRASSLLLTLFSMLPLWRGIDPLPILQEVEKRKKQLEAQRKDKKMEDKNAKEVGYLFDNVNTKNPGDQG